MAVHSYRGSDPTAREDGELPRLTLRDGEGGSSGGGDSALHRRKWQDVKERNAEESQDPPQRNESGGGTLGRGLQLARSFSRRVELCASLGRCALRCTVMEKREKRELRYASVKMETKRAWIGVV